VRIHGLRLGMMAMRSQLNHVIVRIYTMQAWEAAQVQVKVIPWARTLARVMLLRRIVKMSAIRRLMMGHWRMGRLTAKERGRGAKTVGVEAGRLHLD